MPTWLGIDIGTTAVKVAVVHSSYRRVALVALVSVDVTTPPGGSPAVAEAVRAAVTAAFKGKVSGGDGVAAAIDGSRAAVRTLALPPSAQRQLKDVLTYELEAQVPFDIATSVFDWRVLPSKPRPEAPPELSVLAAVAPLEDVRARIDVIKGAISAEPERIGVGAFPLANLSTVLPVLGEEGPTALLDLGTRSSEVLIMAAGEPVFARTISAGTEGLPASAPRLFRELRTTIQAYRAQGGPEVLRIFLCGGGAFKSGAQASLAAHLQIPVEILPAPPGLDVSAVPAERVQELPLFAKAVGLAMSLGARAGLNLRRGPLAYERGFGWMREWVPWIASLAAMLLLSFGFSVWARLHAASREKAALEGALGTVSKEVLGEETTSAARAQELLSNQAGGGDDDPMPHADAFDVMIRLSEAIPQSMKHDIDDLDVQKDHVIVQGVVSNIPDAQSIASSLKSERCFQDVVIKRTTQVVGGERQKYVMEFDLKCPEDVKGAKKPGTAASAAPAASGGK